MGSCRRHMRQGQNISQAMIEERQWMRRHRHLYRILSRSKHPPLLRGCVMTCQHLCLSFSALCFRPLPFFLSFFFTSWLLLSLGRKIFTPTLFKIKMIKLTNNGQFRQRWRHDGPRGELDGFERKTNHMDLHCFDTNQPRSLISFSANMVFLLELQTGKASSCVLAT
jgi:hypothetical protein